MTAVSCRNCGRYISEDDGTPAPEHCGNCPPTRCGDCGEMCEWARGVEGLCSCWTRIDTLPLADVKALFAACDDELSIDPRGTPDGQG